MLKEGRKEGGREKGTGISREEEDIIITITIITIYTYTLYTRIYTLYTRIVYTPSRILPLQ
jgi:hypothetical protein